jgi:PKD repeat protein
MLSALAALVLLIVVFRPGDRGSAGTDLADPFGWIEHGLEGELLQVNNATGEIIERVAVGEPGDTFSAVAHGDGALVWNESSGELRMVDPIAVRLSEPLPIELSTTQDPSAIEVFGSDSYEDDVIVLGEDRVLAIDPVSMLSTSAFTSDGSRSALVDSSGRFVDLDPANDTIRRLTTDGLLPVGSVPPPVPGIETLPTLVKASDRLFTVDPARLAVREVLDGGLGPVANCMTAPGEITGGSSDGPGTVPRIVALDPDAAVVSVSEPATASCFQVDLGRSDSNYGAPVVLGDTAYLPDFAQGRVVMVDLLDREVTRSVNFATVPGEPFELEVFGRVVWANEPQGPLAGIVAADGITTVPKIEAVRLTVGDPSDDGDGRSPLAIATQNGDDGSQAVEGEDGVGDETIEDGIDQAQVVDTEVLGVAVEVAEEEVAVSIPNENELLANFRVSASTAKVDEPIRFVDSSSGSPVAWIWDFGDGGGGDGPEIDHIWESEGVYRVELTVFDAAGAESSQSTEIVIIGDEIALPPVADFTFDRATIEEGEAVSFQSRSTGDIDTLVWDFGDGTSADGTGAIHVFDRAGIYSVTLTAANDAGSTAASVNITVVQSVITPVASIGNVATLVEVGQTLTFTSQSINDPTSLRWDFGDGSRASGTTARHSWTAPGTYRVRLTASNSAGSDDAIVDVVVEPALEPPIARLAQSASEVVAGDSIRFTSLSINDPARLVWNFGDGATARGTEVSHTWAQAGTYTVTLRAINAAGDDRVSTVVTIREPVAPPVAGFGLDKNQAGIGEQIQFTDGSTPEPTSWNWDFGDGSSSTSRNPSHAWDAPGTYLVTVTAANEGGQSSAQLPVTIFAEPLAGFEWSADGTVVSFVDRSSSNPNEWLWDFGDGDRSRRQDPEHRYDEPGEYTVTLIAANNVGPSQPFTTTVRVVEAPAARFACSADGFRLRCDGSNSGGADRFQWFAEDAIYTEGASTSVVTFVFAEAGRYEVTLRVTNGAGESDERSRQTTRVDGGGIPEIREVEVESNRNGVVELRARVRNSPNSWVWNVPGGELVTGGSGNRPTFQFTRNGEYQGTVSASNELGSTEVIEFSFVVDGLGPEASFVWAEDAQPGVIVFNAAIGAVGTPSIDWNFGGGEIVGGTIESPIVQFPDDGRFDVTLTVTDDNGAVTFSDRVRWRG